MSAGAPERGRWPRRLAVLAPPYLWLLVFFLVPFAIVLKISLSETAIAQPPYTPVFDPSEGLGGLLASAKQLTVSNYATLFDDPLYWRSYLTSLKLAALSTALVLLIGYPIALAMSRAPARWRPVLVMLVILPFWTSFLIRVYAWMTILGNEGLLYRALHALGLVSQPLGILGTNAAVCVGIVYAYLPFMVLPLYVALERQDDALLEAAADLGCPPWAAFWRITLPLSLPGVIAGSLLVFIPAVGEFVIPDLLGGSETLMIGRTLWVEFFSNRDWPVASAVAVVLLLVLMLPLALLQRHRIE